MEGYAGSKKAAESSNHNAAREGAMGKNDQDNAKEKQYGCSASREVKGTKSSRKNASGSSRTETRAGNLMTQRWLDESPKEEPFSSVGYCAKHDEKRQ